MITLMQCMKFGNRSPLACLWLLALFLSSVADRTSAQSAGTKDDSSATATRQAAERSSFLLTESEIAAALAEAPSAATQPEERMAWMDRFLELNRRVLLDHETDRASIHAQTHGQDESGPRATGMPLAETEPADVVPGAESIADPLILGTEAEIAAALAEAPSAATHPEERMAWMDRFLELNRHVLLDHESRRARVLSAAGSEGAPTSGRTDPAMTHHGSTPRPAGSDIATALALAPSIADPEARIAWIDTFLQKRTTAGADPESGE